MILSVVPIPAHGITSGAFVRERNYEVFGNEFIWRYPISDGYHMGTFIVPVQEGILSVPYDIVDKEDYEILEPEHISLFDVEAVDYFIDDWLLFSDDLLDALRGMRDHLKEGE